VSTSGYEATAAERLRVDAANACIWRGETPLPLTPKCFTVLRYLIEHPRRLVTKRELLDAVWAGTYVGDAVLKVAVLKIRKALGDDPTTPRFIQTVHRRGYRFVGEGEVEVETRRPRAGGGEPAAATPSLAVGRGDVLLRLDQLLERAVGRERQIVFVTGEAGIGKSTVVSTFLQKVEQSPVIRVARGQCLETLGRGEAYHPFLEAFARLCRQPGGETLVALLRRHAPSWLAELPWLIEPGEREGLNREVLGLTRERMLREMAVFLETLTAELPLVLVLEDLQWSDESTLDLIMALGKRRERARLLLVGTFRPTDAPQGESSVRSLKRELSLRRECIELPLPFLGDAEVAEYLARRFALSQPPGELARIVHRRTDGNAFFVVNFVDDLVARGAIVEHEGEWDLTHATSALGEGTPETLRETIEKRLERLSAPERRLLEVASVAGVEFATTAVAAVLEEDPHDVEERCEELARKAEMLRTAELLELPDGSVTGRYGFRHALYQNVLYDRVAAERRTWIHRRIGLVEEARRGKAADEIAADLALHFERARDSGRAVEYLRQAARRDAISPSRCLCSRRDARRLANREAAESLERAIGLTERLPEERSAPLAIAVREQLGLLRRSMGDMHGAAREFAALVEFARAHGQVDQEAKALLYLASALTWMDREGRRKALEDAARVADRIEDDLLRAHVRGYCAYWNLQDVGWRAQDAAACAEAVEAARRAGNRDLLSLHVARSSYFECLRSRYRLAARMAEEGVAIAIEVGNAFEYMACQHYRASALLHLGEWGAMLATLREAIEIAERNEHRLWATFFRLQMAGLFLNAFAYEPALAICERALEEARGAAHRDGVVFALMLSILAHLGVGRRERALPLLEELERTGRTERHLVGWASQMSFHHGLGEHSLAAGDIERASAAAELVTKTAEASGERTYLALGRALSAAIAMHEGRGAAADEAVARALDALAGGGAPLAEWRVHAVAAAGAERARARDVAARHWARSAEVLHALADSLGEGDAEIRASLLESPVARSVLAGSASRGGRTTA
jgi:DNA-binding winged helix-turn-helix (wHTH) protein/tetratricopeptide (TPR) repeat protein